MPSTIKIKNSNTAGVVPSSLAAGELAINRADSQLYFLNGSGGISAVTDTIDGGVASAPNLLLLRFDGNSTDSSVYNRTVTAVGNATTSTVQKKFGTHAALFDGSGDRFDVPSSADFNLGASDFTVDFWAWINSSTNGVNERLVVFEGTTQTRGILISDTTKTAIGVNLFGTGWQILSSAGAISNQTWFHCALVRSGTTTTLYINGTSVGSTTSQTLPTTNSSVSIGGNTVRFADSNFNGYIDEVRVVNSAVWTTNFTPPASQYGQYLGSSTRTQSMRLRGGTAAILASVNPTPAAREPVVETDTRVMKIGDGTTAYNSLGYLRPYVTATDRLLGRSTAGAGVAEEITCTAHGRSLISGADAAATRTTLGLAASATTDTTNATNISSGTLNSARLPTIGNITNAGAIGSTANLPVITTTSGVLTTGNFGTAANSFCQGNDPRLACQAWVNFNATSSAALSGTYSQSGGTTLTCTVTAHGLANNQIAWLTFTSGTATSSAYVVTVTGANTFTIQTTAATTSGNVSVMRRTIRASNNVSSVAYNTVGDFFVNFATAMSDANYAAVITPGGTANAFLARAYDDGTARTTMALRILCVTLAAGNATIDPANVSVAVFR